MSYQFDKTCGGEQEYSIIDSCHTTEMRDMILYAADNNVPLVAIMDAEGDVVMITTQRIADLLLPLLNDTRLKPLDKLNYEE